MQIDAAALASLSRVPGFPSRTAPLPPAPAPTRKPLPSFWTAHYTSPFQDKGATDPLPDKADVVVIGSGLTGVSAVDELVRLHLASASSEHTREEDQPTLRIVVLEARTFCSGATGRNGGHLTAYPIARFGTLCARWGVDEAKRAVRLEEEGVRWVLEGCEREGWTEDVELRSGKGTLVMFDTPEQVHEVEAQLALAAEAGEDVGQARWVSREEAMETYGAKTFRALLVPGNTLYPLKLVTKLFGRASSRVEEAAVTAAAAGHRPPISLDLFTHCLVDAVERSPDLRPASKPTWLVRTARGTIRTSHVLHATNAYASHALPSLASPSFSAGRILPTRAQMLELVPSTPPKREEAWANAFSSENAPRNSTYFFQRAIEARENGGSKRNVQGGEILIGGMRERVPGMEWGVADDGALNPVVGDALRGAVGEMFPSKFGHEGEGLRVGMEWTGVLGYREEGNPMVGSVYIDEEKQDGQWIAAGYSGHGMPRAPLCAHLVASLIHHHLFQSSAVPASPLSPPFQLPAYFPRHLLSTSDGVGRPDTRLDEEGEVEGGWLWVRRESVRAEEMRQQGASRCESA